jgi:hypothetical protein
MNLVRKTATTLGGIFFAVLLIAALAPKAARGVAAALVQVTNTSANPVPTVSSDANFPYVNQICGTLTACDLPSSFQVPLMTTTGVSVKRLVIEDVDVNCATSIVGGAGSAFFLVPPPADNGLPSGEQAAYFFPITPTPAGSNMAIAHVGVRIYADPGAVISQPVVADGNLFCHILFTGHLETK